MGLLLIGGTLLSHAATSPDERPPLLRVFPVRTWLSEPSSQVATPAASTPVRAVAPSQPSAQQYVAAQPAGPASASVSLAAATPLPLVGRAESDLAAAGPVPPTSGGPPAQAGAEASTGAPEGVVLPPPRTPTAKPVAFAAVPAFGATAAVVPKTVVPPTPTLPPPPTSVPVSPTLPPSASGASSPSSVPSATTSPSAQSAVVAAVAVPPSPPPSVTAAPSATASPREYKLGDTVAITEVLKGFAFTGHWPNSPEGVYATDWYPRSTTQACTNSHRLPLAMPVAGKWRLTSAPSPLGGSQYTLIGELDDGNSVAFTHVDRDVQTGRVAANTVVAFVGVSGLEAFDSAGLNPSHAHTAWNDRVIPNWDGDAGNRPARDFFGQYGFQVEIRDPANGATPQTYMMRRSCGGMMIAPRAPGRG